MAPCSQCSSKSHKTKLNSIQKLSKSKRKNSILLNLCKEGLKSIGNLNSLSGIRKCFACVYNSIVSLAKPMQQYNQIQINQIQIYKKLMENPRLHSVHDDLNVNQFIYNKSIKKTARYYATFLWNWKLKADATKYNKAIEYVQKSLALTIKYMDYKDIQIIKKLIEYNYPTSFSCLSGIVDIRCIKSYMKDKIYSQPSCLNTLIDVMHIWFLVMPVLLELAEHTSWEYIYDCDACLLDLDVLYSIFINLVYKTPQEPDPTIN